MANGFISRLFTRLFAASLVREAYAGILGREPDAAGLKAHVLRVRRTGRLAPVLEEMAHSDEARAGAWKACTESVARHLHTALRGNEPSLEELSEWTLKLQDSAAIHSVVAEMACGPAHWQCLLGQDGDAVASTLFGVLLGRLPDVSELHNARERLGAEGGLSNLLADLENSSEHQARVLRRARAITEPEARAAQGAELLRSAYAGILGREPDTEGLAAYSEALHRHGEAAPVLEEISLSDEAWVRILRGRAASVVAAAYQGLLWRDPEPGEINLYAVPLADSGDLVSFLAELGQCEEHLAGLRERGVVLEPDRFSHPKDLLTDPESVVTATFQALLGRDPEPDAKAAYASLLRERGDLSSFIAEVGRSIEHRKRLLLNRV